MQSKTHWKAETKKLLKGVDNMNIAFAGFRHGHIFGLYNMVEKNDKVNLIGCFEENPDAKKAAETNRGIEFNFNSYDEILENKDVDIIAIGDYYGKRGKMVIDALKAGKHVICDKPICTDLTELDEIEKLSEEKNLQVCCMLDLRYLPQTEKVCQMIKEGVIGEVINVNFTGQHCLDYGNRPAWYYEDGKHGGTINDIAIHGIDVIRLITGKNLTKVNYARTWNAYADKEPQFKDCGQFAIEMENMSVMADISYAAPKYNGILPTYWDFYFWGTKGMIKFNMLDSSIYLYGANEEKIECENREFGYLDALLEEIEGKDTLMNTKGILESQRQVLTIQKAAE